MKLTPEQLKSIEKLANLTSGSDLSLYQTITDSESSIKDKIDTGISDIDKKIDDLLNKVASIEIPEQKDHTEHMNKMMDMIEKPVDITVTLNII